MVTATVGAGLDDLPEIRTLALAVLRQAVDDMRFRPYGERRHRCCPLPTDQCAHRFMANGQGHFWCDVAGVSSQAVITRLRQRLSLS